MVGSVAFRTSMFTTYEIVHTGCDSDKMKQNIPGTGTQYRVLLAAFIAGSVRAVVECPFEYMKVKRQTGQSFSARDLFKGFAP